MAVDIVIDVAGQAAGSPSVAREFVYSVVSPAPPLVTLSLGDDTGNTSWYWEILSQPIGASASLSSATVASPTFTPTADIPGTYLIKCTANGVTENTNALAFSTEHAALRIPAAGEIIEFGSRGWETPMDKLINSTDTHIGSDGSDHSFIDQDVTTGGTPSFVGVTLTGDLVASDNSLTGVDTITFTDVNGTIAGIENQNLVDKSASETIAGEWTFSIFPITPSAAPDADYEVANKKYVDDTVATSDTFLELTDTPVGYSSGNAIYTTNGTPDAVIETTVILTEAANTFNITKGTASLDIAAGAALDVDANLTVSSACTIDQALNSGAAPTFTADNFSDGGSNAIITTTQETNFETAYSHSQDNTQAHSDYLLNSGDDTTSGTITMAGAILSANSATITHSGSTSLVIASTSGTVGVESIVFSGTELSSATGIELTPAADNDITLTISDTPESADNFINLVGECKFGSSANGASIQAYQSNLGLYIKQRADLAAGNFLTIGTDDDAELTDDDGHQIFTAIAPEIAQSGTASYTALEVDVTETSTGSGSNLLLDLQVGSSSKFSVSNDGSTAGAKFKEHAFFPIAWAMDGSAPPAFSEDVVSGNGSVVVRNFDDATVEDVVIPWRVPSDIVAADGIKFSVTGIITNATAPAATEGVSFKLSGYSVGTGDALTGTFGTEVESKDADLNASGCTAQYDVFKTAESGTVTITDLAADELVMLHFERDTADADDDYGQDVGVIGVTIAYTKQTESL